MKMLESCRSFITLSRVSDSGYEKSFVHKCWREKELRENSLIVVQGNVGRVGRGH